MFQQCQISVICWHPSYWGQGCGKTCKAVASPRSPYRQPAALCLAEAKSSWASLEASKTCMTVCTHPIVCKIIQSSTSMPPFLASLTWSMHVRRFLPRASLEYLLSGCCKSRGRKSSARPFACFCCSCRKTKMAHISAIRRIDERGKRSLEEYIAENPYFIPVPGQAEWQSFWKGKVLICWQFISQFSKAQSKHSIWAYLEESHAAARTRRFTCCRILEAESTRASWCCQSTTAFPVSIHPFKRKQNLSAIRTALFDRLFLS